jgi:putative transcription antitermination factor YqgF
VKVLALDFGSARTGVAVSDPTGTLARPRSVIQKAGTESGLDSLIELIREEAPELIVVGMPITLRGEHGEQARETAAFVETLRGRVTVPVETFDERFTSVLAGGDDAKAAAHLLSSYLEWSSSARR